MINLQDIMLEGEEIRIDDDKAFNAIGESAVLRNCVVRCKVPARCLSICGTLQDSTIISESKLRNFSWFGAKLVDCTFQGTFKEHNFGSMSTLDGYCKSGVFTEADLDDAVFYGKLNESHRFPTWPYFVVIDPHGHAAEMKEAAPSVELSMFGSSIKYLNKEASAMVVRVDTFCKRFKVGSEAVRSYFSQFDFVKM